MYAGALWLHSYWRWVVVLAALVTLARSGAGWALGWPWTPRARAAQTAFVGSLDLQLLLGLLLYFFLSPFTLSAFSDLGAAMKNPHTRFWAVEHAPVQLFAVALAHVGSIRAKRATSDRERHRRVTVFFAIVLVLIAAAIPWPGLDIARPLFR
jgi:hypothetical protein